MGLSFVGLSYKVILSSRNTAVVLLKLKLLPGHFSRKKKRRDVVIGIF